MAEYIDKEKAKKILNEEYASYASPKLDEVPIADVVEVRHGKWLTRYIHNRLSSGAKVRWDVKSCSICTHTQLCVSDYCPSCGAKMDKECE